MSVLVDRPVDSGLSLRQVREAYRAKGVFYTPPSLAAFLAGLLPAEPGNVFDPTCGHGNLLAQFGDGVPKFGVDINAEAVAHCQATLGNFQGVVADVLTTGLPASWPKFDAIIGNPPFSIAYDETKAATMAYAQGAPCVPSKGKADWAFILLMLHHLADDGVAAFLNFPGVCYRGGREGKLRRWVIENGHVRKVIHVPGGTFEDTTIPTVAIVMGKQPVEAIEMIDQEYGLERTVSLAEVAAQGFALSVGAYVSPEPTKEQVDPLALELKARAQTVAMVKHQVAFSEAVAELEADNPAWPPVGVFRDQLRAAIGCGTKRARAAPAMSSQQRLGIH